jgi:hypothetical protein
MQMSRPKSLVFDCPEPRVNFFILILKFSRVTRLYGRGNCALNDMAWNPTYRPRPLCRPQLQQQKISDYCHIDALLKWLVHRVAH